MRKFLSLFLVALAVSAVRAAGFPQLSGGGDEYWYYLKFTQGSYVVAANGDAVVCTSAFPTGRAAQLWKVEGSASAGYTFTNKLGQTLYAVATTQGSEIRAASMPGSLSKFRINTRGAYYTITPYSNTGQALNCWGGMGLGNDIKLYDSGDANAPMEFLTETEAVTANTLVNVIPYPKSVEQTDCGELDLRALEGITYFSDSTRLLAERFAADLKRAAGIDLPLVERSAEATGTSDPEHPLIQLLLSPGAKAESYDLSSCMGGITIRANDFGGFFNAFQTLRQLLPPAIYGEELCADQPWTMESLEINDEPALRHRGFHFDVSRHFFTKEEVMRLLDLASIYKLNRFHWHLTDDQGWRIEIPEYPKLTTVGAVRKRSLTINDPTNGAEFYDDTEYGRGCYYTLDDLREVVAYAKERNIEIIPEVDLPGHMVAAIAAYPELSCDPSRTYEVRVAKGISTDVLNVGDDAVIDFLQCVLGHMAQVFPYDIIHLGGDECPTTVWQGNADCARRIQEEGLSGVNELQPWLVEKLGSYLRDNFGKRVLVWDELLEHWKSSYTVQPIVMAWRGQNYVSQAADKGFESIVVPYSPLYFDLLQISPDKMEIDAPYFGGYGDGSVNSVDRVYNFNPTATVGGREQYVLGTQANLWTESLSTLKEAEYCYYPRLIALSETAWMPASQKDFAGFYTRLQHQAGVLDAKHVFYAKHYIEPADKTPVEADLDEARAILAASTPGAVGYPDQAAYDALEAAADAAAADASNADALAQQLQAYKSAPVAMPEDGKVYKITSASTYYRNRYEGSSLYADGNALRIHYTAQTEPEELWQFRKVEGNSAAYRLVSLLDGREVRLTAQANSAATFGETGTNIIVRKATKPAGGYSYIPGVVNIKNGRYNLYAQLSGQAVANLDSTLCYPGTWRIEEVTDFTLWTKGLADKAAHLLETSVPGKAGEPTEEALAYLREKVLEPAQAALADAGTPVSEQTYRELAARYDEFLRMERLSILDGIDEGYYYYINNAYHTSYYACANASSRCVEPKTFAATDGYKWVLRKQTDGTILIESKLTGTCAYVTSNAADQRVRLGRDYKWTLKEVTTDQGNTAIAITDGSGAFSWYTNPGVWDYVLLKPYDWGASVWQFVKTTEEVPTGIRSLEAEGDTTAATLYDMQGRQMVQTPQRGVYIQDGRKLVR